MWFEFFVTKRILHNKERSFSRLIIGIARVAIALSLTVMIISTSLVNGFRSTISDKVYGCLLYTSDAADERSSVDLGGRRIIKKKNSAGVRQRQRHPEYKQNTSYIT